jgi:hypothetical protein
MHVRVLKDGKKGCLKDLPLLLLVAGGEQKVREEKSDGNTISLLYLLVGGLFLCLFAFLHCIFWIWSFDGFEEL